MIRRPPRSTRTDTLFPYTTLFRSHRHTLHSVRAGLELQAGEDARAGDLRARLLVAADLDFGGIDDLEAPALQLSVALVHAQEVGGKERRLVAAGAGAHLEDGIARVGLVLRQQQDLQRVLRSEERRVGKACVSTCGYWWS